jgi:DNA polymerase V
VAPYVEPLPWEPYVAPYVAPLPGEPLGVATPANQSANESAPSLPAIATATARPMAPASAAPTLATAGLAQLLIRAPDRTVLVPVRGDSMRGAGICHGDLLLVERRSQAAAGQVVVARLREGLIIKRLVRRHGHWWLVAAHPDYPALELGRGRIWGVAIHRIRRLPPAMALPSGAITGPAPPPAASSRPMEPPA